jgi:thymidylate synthase (FAD)
MTQIQVLDQGYVEHVESWGTGKYRKWVQTTGQIGHYEPDGFEAGIIEAARQSTQGSFRGWEADEKLLKHLYNNNHSTPFEFSGMIIEVQAPIMVFREWHRHRTQSYNEMSARYAPLPDLYYACPMDEVLERARAAAKSQNKQAGSTGQLDESAIIDWVDRDAELEYILEKHYKRGLEIGVPKELARKKMPVDHYSRMRASANLRNWLGFMTLRMDPLAQKEIRMYANAVAMIIAEQFPQTAKLFFTRHENLLTSSKS